MPKNLTHRVATILCACLFLISCGPSGGQNQTTQNQIDKAQAQQIAGSFVAAVKHNVGVLAWQMLPSALQDGQTRVPNPHVLAVSCGNHVLAYVRAGHENALKLTGLTSLKALRITSAVRRLWPQSTVALTTNDNNIMGGAAGLNVCASQLEAARANQDLGQGPVVVVPLSAVTDTLDGFDPTDPVYSYTPINSSNPCEQKLQACRLDSASKQVVCSDATEPQGDNMPLIKNTCVQATEAVSVADNTDITAWEAAIEAGIITANDAYTINANKEVTKVTTAMAEKLDCPEDPDATGIVENPQVTRTTGWVNDGSGRVPVSNAGSVVACTGGWQGALYAKYERRSCSLKKITSTGAGVATTDTKPQTVFQLYYVGAKCQTATPVVNTATCPGNVANSNGSGSFTISRHFAMTQPVALTWEHNKNKSTSRLASPAAPPPEDLGYTTLSRTVDDSGRGFSANLGNALAEANVLQKNTQCNIGNACDTSTSNPPVTTGFICPEGWTQSNGYCTTTSGIPGQCPPGTTGPIDIDGQAKCEIGGVCVGGNPDNGCKGQCPDGSAGPTCPPNKICKTGDHGDGTTCTRDAVCPSTLLPPNSDGSCPASGSNADTIECPAGTTPIRVANVITGCEKAPECPVTIVPTTPSGSITFFIEEGLPSGHTMVRPKVCRNEETDAISSTGVCYAFDPRDEQPTCFGENSCRPGLPFPVEGGNMADTINILTGQGVYSSLHLLPPTVNVNIINFDPTNYDNINQIAGTNSKWIVVLADTFKNDKDRDTYTSAYLPGKTFCASFGRVNSTNPQCYQENFMQAIGQQKGGNTEMRLFSLNIDPELHGQSGIKTPIIARFGLSTSAMVNELTQVNGILQRSVR